MDALALRVRSALPDDLLLAGAGGLDDLCRIYALLVLVRGPGISAEDVHDAWATWMAIRGVDHQAIVPFADLDEETKLKDEPFAAALRSLAADEDQAS